MEQKSLKTPKYLMYLVHLEKITSKNRLKGEKFKKLLKKATIGRLQQRILQKCIRAIQQ